MNGTNAQAQTKAIEQLTDVNTVGVRIASDWQKHEQVQFLYSANSHHLLTPTTQLMLVN